MELGDTNWRLPLRDQGYQELVQMYIEGTLLEGMTDRLYHGWSSPFPKTSGKT